MGVVCNKSSQLDQSNAFIRGRMLSLTRSSMEFIHIYTLLLPDSINNKNIYCCYYNYLLPIMSDLSLEETSGLICNRKVSFSDRHDISFRGKASDDICGCRHGL